MPAQTTRKTLARHWELLKLLPSKGSGKTASDLTRELKALGFPVSKRQVERDLWDLYEVFQIECNGSSPPFGWKWPRGASVDLPAMGISEALSLCLLKDTVSPMLPTAMLDAVKPRFKLAEQRVATASSDKTSVSWLKKVRSVLPTQPMLPATVDQEAQEAVHEALLLDRQVKITYSNANSGEPVEILMHPLGLVTRGHVSYLIATAWDYDDIRLYAMHRVVRAEGTYEPARRPENFDIDAFIARGSMHFGEENEIELRVRVGDYLARVLSETPLSKDQTIEGGVVTATVRDTWQMRWWILSQGDAIEVLYPPSLRQSVGEELQRASALYRSHSSSKKRTSTGGRSKQ